MITLTGRQAEIYNAIFKPHHKASIRKDSLETFLKEDILNVFGHDIFKHFLIPKKFYSSENICYYLQNIILYAVYMGYIANSNRWPSEDFCNQLAELCLNCIKVFFRDFQSAFDEDFCNHLKQTVILSFKNQVADKDRVKEIIQRQFRCLAFKVSIKTIDPLTESLKDFARGTLSVQSRRSHMFNYARDMVYQQTEKEFVIDLLERCEAMCKFRLSAEADKHLLSIQQVQNSAVCALIEEGGYAKRGTVLMLFALLCYITLGISLLRENQAAPYALMGSFVLTLLCYLNYSHNDEAYVNIQRKNYEKIIKKFEDELHDSVKIETIEYDIKPPYGEGALSPSVSPPSVRIYTFVELPAPVAERALEDGKRHAAPKASEKGGKLVPSRFSHFSAQKPSPINLLSVKDLQDVPADMRLQCVDEKTNLFLLYDPNKEYESDWILPSLETARVSHSRANTGLISVGRLKAFNGREEVAVYELKNLHHGKGEAAQRLLIPVVSLTKKDGTTVRVLDCRGALFLKDGLHKKGMENYRFDSSTQQISHKGNISLGKISESSSSRRGGSTPAMSY